MLITYAQVRQQMYMHATTAYCGRDGQDHVLIIHNAAIEGITMQLHTYGIRYKKHAYTTMTTRDILSTVYYILSY